MDYLFVLAAAPIVIILFYIYIRDKYEKEPVWLAVIGLFWGFLMTAPIIFIKKYLYKNVSYDIINNVFFASFVSAALVEEVFKFIILYFLIMKNKEFNESFDAVVYSVFVSLGFAFCENIFYVFSPKFGGINTGVLRAIFSVPAHALFGVCMGYYFSFSKFYVKKSLNVLFSLFAAVIWHGLYDFFLLSEFRLSWIIFLVFVVYIWLSGFSKMNKLIQSSPFK